MAISPNQLTYRRHQSDSPTTMTVFVSMDGTLVDGSPIEGPWRGVTVTLTDAQAQVILDVIDLAKTTEADRINALALEAQPE